MKNSLKRIFLYRACLVRLKLMGVEKVFSLTLANETGVTPDQVRKDFSEFNIRGNKRGGYYINDLLEKMEKLFHANKDNNIVLIGMGNMGLALSKYSKFVQRNMNIALAGVQLPQRSLQSQRETIGSGQDLSRRGNVLDIHGMGPTFAF